MEEMQPYHLLTLVVEVIQLAMVQDQVQKEVTQ
jgi:hypothetical protein